MVDLVTRDEKATNETARKFRKSAWKLNVPRNSTDTALGHSNVSMAGEIYFSFRLSIRSVTFWNNFLQSTATVLQYKKKMHTLTNAKTMDRRKFSKKRLRRFFENLLLRKVIKGYPKNPYFFLEKIDKTSHIDRKCAIFHIKIRNFLKKPNKKRFFRDWKSKITEFAKNSPKYMKMQFFRNCDFLKNNVK